MKIEGYYCFIPKSWLLLVTQEIQMKPSIVLDIPFVRPRLTPLKFISLPSLNPNLTPLDVK